MTRVNVTDGDELKTDDTAPSLSVSLVKNNGVPQVLTDYEVTFQMREAGGEELVVDASTSDDPPQGETESALTKTDADLGKVQYKWQPEDTATSGAYECEFTIDDNSGSILTFPNQGFFTVQIQEGL